MALRVTALGDYLRARREQVRPDDVGLSHGPRRRVPGLRREEVATLAGISSAYYLRLEQGRDTHPSAQVVNAIALALQLDDGATEHLHKLAGSTDSHPTESAVDTITNGLDQLVDQLPVPAVVSNRYQDVLAASPCARALSPGFTPRQNFLRWRLLDPAARELYVDWDEATEVAVSGLREVAGSAANDPRLRAFVDELSTASQRFRELWARADVGYRGGLVHVRHPLVGDLFLRRNRLTIPHSAGQHLLIYHAEPGSETATALEQLRSLGPTGNEPRRPSS